MKHLPIFAAVVLAFSVSAAQAGEPTVSNSLKSELKIFRAQSYALAGGVLRVQLRDALVTPTVFDSVAEGVCSEAGRDPKGFDAMGIERVEVLNSVDAQGFAIMDAGSICKRRMTMKRAEADALLQANVVRCEAGICRRR